MWVPQPRNLKMWADYLCAAQKRREMAGFFENGFPALTKKERMIAEFFFWRALGNEYFLAGAWARKFPFNAFCWACALPPAGISINGAEKRSEVGAGGEKECPLPRPGADNKISPRRNIK